MHKNLTKLGRTISDLETYLTTAFELPQPEAHQAFSERYLNPDEVVQFVTACHNQFDQLNRQLLTIQDHFLALRYWLEQRLEQYTEGDLGIWQSFENEINLLLADVEAINGLSNYSLRRNRRNNTR